jgi:hypothetical protein
MLYSFALFLRGVGAVSPGYSVRIIPILGSMVSPPCSATRISASIAAPCERVVLGLRQLCDVVAGLARCAARRRRAGRSDRQRCGASLCQASILDPLLDACLLMPQQRRNSRHPSTAAEGEEHRRNGEAKRLRGFEIEFELEACSTGKSFGWVPLRMRST